MPPLERLIDRGESVGADGTRRRVVEWPVESGLAILAEIDPNSARILKSTGRVATGALLAEFITEYSEFVDARPISYAARERHYAMGQYIGETRISEVGVLDAVTDAEFSP